TVARFVRDEKLREALSFHSLLVGGNPFETSSLYTLIHYLERSYGVFFPRGGTGALVQALVKVFGELGGELRLSTAVGKIAVRGGKHWIGPAEAFDAVVSNADVHHTYSALYGDTATQRKLERSEWSMSLFVLYFGARGTWPGLAHHTVLFGPRYQGLLKDVFHGNSLPDDFSLYLHAPTVTDPSLAPPGDSAFYVLSPVPHLGNAPIDWSRAAPAYAERIFKALEARALPGLRERLATTRWFTPDDFRSQLRAYQGAAFSLAPLLTQSAWFRPHNRDPRIPGLYLVGAGTHPGAGLPGVISSAKATAELVARDLAEAAA
ncbi:MAG TPA: phytoene desaturase family protein, partial [Myxococcales bacterium]|nr:phytoene desaturase family protein [Myxococcales bacterium]